MNLKKYLSDDVYRRTYMSYASSQPYPKGQTAQLGPHPSAAVSALARGCPAIGPGLLHLRAPGLSLPRAGTATEAPRPGRRCQSILHRQAFAPSRGAIPHLCRFDRIDLERDRQPCFLGGPAPWGRSWLIGRAVRREPSIWNTTSTDYCRTSWLRPTSCSHRTGAGRLLQARSRQAARRW
jgi:hypothetical protein